MEKAKCPVCGCKTFYVKNPEDEYEVYVFTCEGGEVCFEEDSGPAPEITDETETYCNDCAWHDRFQKVNIDFK